MAIHRKVVEAVVHSLDRSLLDLVRLQRRHREGQDRQAESLFWQALERLERTNNTLRQALQADAGAPFGEEGFRLDRLPGSERGGPFPWEGPADPWPEEDEYAPPGQDPQA